MSTVDSGLRSIGAVFMMGADGLLLNSGSWVLDIRHNGQRSLVSVFHT